MMSAQTAAGCSEMLRLERGAGASKELEGERECSKPREPPSVGMGQRTHLQLGTWQLHIVLCQQHLKKVMTLEKLNSAPLPLSAGPGHAPGRKAGNIRL
jgi:hypothetical protein